MPPAGTLARLNTPVQVWLAVPVPIEVPGVVGRREADAAAMLRDRRLRVGSVRPRESAEPRGVVVEQAPQAGQRVGAQTAVDLWIATPRRIQVPDLRGRNRADAIDAIRRAGLTVGPALEREGPEPQGTVADQQPAAGVELTPTAPSHSGSRRPHGPCSLKYRISGGAPAPRPSGSSPGAG